MDIDWAATFERFRFRYRREDGSKWTGAAIERATGGRVSTHYVSELRRGKIREPSYTRIYAISRAMGIPVEDWIEHGIERRGTE